MIANHAGASGAYPSDARWRTLDIVVVAVLGVAFGVVFWSWNALWSSTEPLFQAVKPLQYLISGVWLMPAVVAPLIVRKPGAALFAEIAAASVSAMLGSYWGVDVILSGIAQGAGAELVFALGRYRAWGPLAAALAGVGAAVGEAAHDIPIYYPAASFPLAFQLAVVGAMLLSGLVVAGLGGWALVRALRATGVLEPFPADAAGAR